MTAAFRRGWFFVAFAFCALQAGCSDERALAPIFHEEDNPETLSEWGVLRAKDGVLELAAGTTPYDLATPLFSDYALKLRTVWTPTGTAATYDEMEAFDFPVGTIVTKTFYYETGESRDVVRADGTRTATDGAMSLSGVRLLETRILARREQGWAAFAYVWNEAQTQARLKRAGDVIPLTLERPDGRREDFAYLVPNANQCAGCHATNAETRAIQPIGLKARHLNKPSAFHPGFNQLDAWRLKGLLAGDFKSAAAAPRNADWTDTDEPLAARARAYLDVNCSHCHSPVGPAGTSGLDLEPGADGPALGLCKAPIAAGSGSGGRPYGIVPGAPGESILLFRMETKDPAAMMPELGRAVVHEEGAALIRNWIAGMEGGCAPAGAG
ncbi:SO2930 family diheme c-type cytochrome [Amphiplicatus metriothermophilus]|uniref:Cytochrome c domain-containing protein n=1 Tax=Amphiplicatus metriothermophilus TaxID=1519374 RepID=A0A239PUW3_9PROT|nr:SO2930 family diheme c-type cytochrome [Amphiplicatus metriothermophilus]MBB5519527.1 putative repeat protein (TIGR03806 family) [Amphiplicatus metriothermophilus]SNT74094.1 conserved hypothetical protein, HNE_0200 family [Amphiplicatus metriothermophilus]